MQIQPGTRLGSYEIVGPLGAGGMGEVYRAHDPKLVRDVAIKVLPEDLAADPERLARFEREARALAALNHPNIATVHGFERERSEDGDPHFLVMELVEGEDLAERIRRGPVPPGEAIAIFLQIAEGLEAAHERGIVHRDLKPANIKVTEEGRVKILDFGLAKAMEPHGETDADLSQSPTMTAAATVRGEILGTAAYMSPEQARGKAVDERTDIWAFGVCLFEAVSGQRPFRGESAPDILAAVLRADPEVSGLAGPTSSLERLMFDRLLERCLAKNPKQRYHDIADVRLDLEAISRTTGEVPTPRSRDPQRRWTWLAAATGWLLAAAAILWMALAGDGSPAEPETRAVRQQTRSPGVESGPSLSPDGGLLLYRAAGVGGLSDLFLERIGGERPINLTSTPELSESGGRFSPDGQQIVFAASEPGETLIPTGNLLFVMGATGESRRRLPANGSAPAWSPQGRQIVYQSGNTLFGQSEVWVLDLESEESRALVTERRGTRPTWSPDGEQIAFDSHDLADDWSLWTVDVASGSLEQIGEGMAPFWASDGSLYFLSRREGFQGAWRLRPPVGSSEPEPLRLPTDHVNGISVSNDAQRLLYSTLDVRSSLVRVPVLDGRVELSRAAAIVSGSVQYHAPALSKDQEYLAFQSGETYSGQIWVADLSASRLEPSAIRMITPPSGGWGYPQWTPDGHWISADGVRGDEVGLWVIRPDGTGLQRIAEFQERPDGGIWDPEGRWVLVPSAAEATTWMFPVEEPGTAGAPPRLGERSVWVKCVNGAIYWPLQISPDGRKIAGACWGNGLHGVYDRETESYVWLWPDNGEWPIWIGNDRVLRVSPTSEIYDAKTGELLESLDFDTGDGDWTHGQWSPQHEAVFTQRWSVEGDLFLVEQSVP